MDTSVFSDHRLCEAFWSCSPIPQAIVDPRGKIVLVNAAWSTLLGYSKSELEGRHFKEITHPADLNGDISEVSRLISDPTSDGYTMVKRYISKQGEVVWVELHVFAIRAEAGSLECFAVCIVPLPATLAQTGDRSDSLLRSFGSGCVALVKDRPREFLIAVVIGLVAAGRIPVDSIVEIIKSFFVAK